MARRKNPHASRRPTAGSLAPARPSAQAPTPSRQARPVHHGLARVMSKLGYCSRTQAYDLIAAGRVAVDGEIQHDAEFPVDLARAGISVDGVALAPSVRHYIMLNKPRGLITSAADERGRDTVYALLQQAGLPWLAPVGRLDRASEGLLLLSNDPAWAARITDPATHLSKTYHVQINRVPDETLFGRMRAGVSEGEDTLRVRGVTLLRHGEKNAWLEITLDEGRNRHIRRLMNALDIEVLRLLRVAIGSLVLGNLAKAAWRALDSHEVSALAAPGTGPGDTAQP